jgi:hypothetical protein
LTILANFLQKMAEIAKHNILVYSLSRQNITETKTLAKNFCDHTYLYAYVGIIDPFEPLQPKVWPQQAINNVEL